MKDIGRFMDNNERIALYAGTFDPITFGHLDIIKRSLSVYDRVIIAVSENSQKEPLLSIKERLSLIERVALGINNLDIVSFSGLTVEYAREMNAGFLVRGLRALSDFEFEFKMALANRKLAPDIDTVFFMPSEKYFYLSSSLVKEIARLGGEIDDFVPRIVVDKLLSKLTEGKY